MKPRRVKPWKQKGSLEEYCSQCESWLKYGWRCKFGQIQNNRYPTVQSIPYSTIPVYQYFNKERHTFLYYQFLSLNGKNFFLHEILRCMVYYPEEHPVNTRWKPGERFSRQTLGRRPPEGTSWLGLDDDDSERWRFQSDSKTNWPRSVGTLTVVLTPKKIETSENVHKSQPSLLGPVTQGHSRVTVI